MGSCSSCCPCWSQACSWSLLSPLPLHWSCSPHWNPPPCGSCPSCCWCPPCPSYCGWSLLSSHHFLYGKREAEAEAEPYTIGQVYAGLPVANAIATGHPHNVGVITNMVSPVHHSVHHPYMGYP